jgi:uncharacterized C2H2 Zn-finger protein
LTGNWSGGPSRGSGRACSVEQEQTALSFPHPKGNDPSGHRGPGGTLGYPGRPRMLDTVRWFHVGFHVDGFWAAFLGAMALHRSCTKGQLPTLPVYANVGSRSWMALQWNAGKAEKIRMPEIRKRRSPRSALELPIRVFGTDFQGRDFVEDSTTLVVSRHGGKIQLMRKLIPEQEIRILCQGNNREGLFRVVSQASEPVSEFSFWGIECLNPSENIWEGAQPRPRPKLASTAGPHLNPKLASRAGPQLDPKPASRAGPQLGPKLAPRAGPQLDPKLAPRAGPQLDPKPASRARPQLDPKLASRPGPQVDPNLSLKDKSAVQAVLRCPECGMRELIDLSERQIRHIHKSRGLMRGCPACGATSLWKRVAVRGS